MATELILNQFETVRGHFITNEEPVVNALALPSTYVENDKPEDRRKIPSPSEILDQHGLGEPSRNRRTDAPVLNVPRLT